MRGWRQPDGGKGSVAAGTPTVTRADALTDLIDRTPLLRSGRLCPEHLVFAKCEFPNSISPSSCAPLLFYTVSSPMIFSNAFPGHQTANGISLRPKLWLDFQCPSRSLYRLVTDAFSTGLLVPFTWV